MKALFELRRGSRRSRDGRRTSRGTILFNITLLLSSLLISYLLVSRVGVHLFTIALVGVLFGTVYILLSFGNLMIPFLAWVLSIGGFRFLISVKTPGLPDLFLDRITLILLFLVFFTKSIAGNHRFRGPYTLDWLLAVNASYVLLLIYVKDMTVFHEWTMSYFMPYMAFFFAKNLVTSRAKIRNFLWALLALTVYYDITAIAEKFKISFLVFPRYILESTMFMGRSSGPFMHAPLFGTVIGMLIPIHLYFIATTKGGIAKVLLYISLFMGFAALYFTYTRGSWLAGLGALAVVAVLNRRHYMKILTPAMIVAPLIGVMLLGVGNDQFLKERVENEDTVGSRLGTVVTAAKVWRANPFFGVGINQYRKVIDDYIAPLDLPIYGTVHVRQFRDNPPHDIYVSRLAETGIVGFSLEWAIYLLILRSFLSHLKRQRQGEFFAVYILPIFGGLFAGYLLGGLAIDYKFFAMVGTLFFSCAGIMYGYRPDEEMEGPEDGVMPATSRESYRLGKDDPSHHRIGAPHVP